MSGALYRVEVVRTRTEHTMVDVWAGSQEEARRRAVGTSYSPVYTWTEVSSPPHAEHTAGTIAELQAERSAR